MLEPVTTTNFPELNLLHRGKVRDMYGIPGHDDKLLMVATDRISAYDVVMDDAIPGKGAVLTELSLFWFNLLGDIIENHLITANVEEYPEVCRQFDDQLAGRSMLVKKTRPLTIECIVRGYISGSFWSAYKKNSVVCGFQLPEGMLESEKLPEPLFTPSTKAEIGDHDMNISFDEAAKIIGQEMAEKLKKLSLELYNKGAELALSKGIIIADTKFEFGMLDGEIILIDEILTPDSSRFWPLSEYEPGRSQNSFDKQYVRDWLTESGWDKTPPGPKLPQELIDRTSNTYKEIYKRLTGNDV
jgi:phosphoribosylaminoimidazole-succinocarboxamide synthase